MVAVTNTNRGKPLHLLSDDQSDDDEDDGNDDDDDDDECNEVADDDGMLDRLPMGVCDKHKQGESYSLTP